jgi:hypothetical protein
MQGTGMDKVPVFAQCPCYPCTHVSNLNLTLSWTSPLPQLYSTRGLLRLLSTVW